MAPQTRRMGDSLSYQQPSTISGEAHFNASALIASGCSIKAVQSALGHRSARMTLDVYGHLFPCDEDRIRGALTGVFESAGEAAG